MISWFMSASGVSQEVIFFAPKGPLRGWFFLES